MTLSPPELILGPVLIAAAAFSWALICVLVTFALKQSSRDASLYPFVGSAVCFFAAAPSPATPSGSYIAGALFVASLILGIFWYRDE